jgi:hypothetical protein
MSRAPHPAGSTEHLGGGVFPRVLRPGATASTPVGALTVLSDDLLHVVHGIHRAMTPTLLRKLLKLLDIAPRAVAADKLPSDGVARLALRHSAHYEQGLRKNSRVENSQMVVRRRERRLKGQFIGVSPADLFILGRGVERFQSSAPPHLPSCTPPRRSRGANHWQDSR